MLARDVAGASSKSAWPPDGLEVLDVVNTTCSYVQKVLLHVSERAMSGVVSAGLGSELDRLLRQTNEQLGAAGRRVAKFIDENRQTVLASSAAALGGYIGTSDATVLRTIQALGFAGLADLKQAILKSAEKSSTPADQMRRTLGDLEQSTGRAVESVLQAHEDGLAVLKSDKCQ